MIKYQHILVVVDPVAEAQPALHRAVSVASLQENATITLFLAIYDFSYEMTSMLSSSERDEMREGVLQGREEWLKSLLVPYADSKVEFHLKVVWHSRPFEAIIQQVQEHHHDLVVKSTHKHAMIQSFIFTPTDWHLLRKCPCPVLLVKERDWPMGGTVLAAVNCCSDDDAQETLNEKVISESAEVARLLSATLHLVNAYPITPVNMALELPDFDPHAYNAAVKKHHERALYEYAVRFSLESESLHLLEGLAEEVIPGCADSIDASLVILGSVGRTGLSAALLGNTAEHVIDKLSCDVLVLRPDAD
ncbi:universal stress protein UspE [Oceanimonas baumannii]|uniref:Universal stress protein E n=1 Tax=Oceanimonas baumannii TaxID=129578 RepID=A0A235CH41_9GAMM|nr:universal stress protein UspE [Oceanimonas baumannii]OYD23843.1 universal stress protein UspE [Oceanimonas baumannii]TDW58832.1 universal stress protein E [Oceanimonas baumannii]